MKPITLTFVLFHANANQMKQVKQDFDLIN